MKRLLATFILAGFLFPSLASAAFTDLPEGNPNKAAIEALVSQGALKGYEDNTFRPDQNVNRAEAIKIILLGLGVKVNEASTSGSNFTDVKKTDWFFPYVGTAKDLGMIKGYEDGSFKPTQTVTRAEAMKMASVAVGVSPENPKDLPFIDVQKDAWYAPYAQYAKDENIVPPQTDGRWHPDSQLSRAKLSEMIYRFSSVKKSGDAFAESTNWLRKAFPTVDVTLKVPFGWYLKGDGVGAVWLLDQERSQFSLLSPYANGGTLLMTRFNNPGKLTASAMFASLDASLEAFTSQTKVNGKPALIVEHTKDEGLLFREWYIVLDNGSLVHFEALRGKGPYSPYLETYLEAIVNSVEYAPGAKTAENVDDAKATLRSAIQVDGTGKAAMQVAGNWDLIETDTIGVGTGPVDYYYSASLDVTLKYERSFDVLLDLREGRTTAF